MNCGRNLPGTVLQRLPMNLAMALSCLSFVCSVGGVFAGADPATGAPEVEARGFMDVTGAIGLHYDVDSGEGDSPILDGMGFENGGLAFGDVDNDGTFELYVSHGQDGEGRLFAFDGRHFVHLANNRGIRPARMDRAGYFIDLDQDGWQDFVSVQSRQAQLFRNDGAGNFREATQRFGLRINRDAHSMAAADYDGDGDLDLLFAHWDNTWNGKPTHYLWRNNGRGRYEDVSRILPIRPVKRPFVKFAKEYSFTPTFADIDSDGDPDILLAGDFRSSQVLRNDAGAGFVDSGGAVIDDDNGMGAAVADYDRDGDLDWFVSSIYDADNRSELGGTGNRLYRNVDGTGVFEDATGSAGVRIAGWAWGACFADFDNDGNADLFVTNGWFDDMLHASDGPGSDPGEFGSDPSRLFMSNGDGTFTERSSALGIDHTGQGRGVVCTDYDGDGGVDIFVANLGAAPTVYRNVLATEHHWLAVDLAGRHDNPQGIGARVTVHTPSGHQVQEVRLGTAYLSQSPPTLHFGLGRERVVSAIEVVWPGPGKQISRLEHVPGDHGVTIRQPEPDGLRLAVAGGAGSGLYPQGAVVALEAESPEKNHRFSHWSSEGGGTFADARSRVTTFTMPANAAAVFAHFLPIPPASAREVSVARLWMDVMLQAIRDDVARPTVHARNLFHLSAAMYDAWAAWSDTAKPYLVAGAGHACHAPPVPPSGHVRRAREEAISHAAWRIVRHRFAGSPNAGRTYRNIDGLMSYLGYEADDGSADGTIRSSARLGHCIGERYIARGMTDGANEANDYAALAYRPVNLPMFPFSPGDPELRDPDRWQPLEIDGFIDQSGFLVTDRPRFVTPEWGRVKPFALADDVLSIRERDDAQYLVYHDPGPPPSLRGPLAESYRWGFALVARWSSHLSPDDGALIDIAPSGIGNIAVYPRTLEDYPSFFDGHALGPGHAINPATGNAYEPQWVPRGDYARVLAEYWADGPDSETPPGHWFVILNAVSEHDALVRRLGGVGPELDPLEWDVKAYFTLGGAMHDAAIAAWGIKGWYDYIRPISALRAMAVRGQSSDPALPSWSADGIPLIEGFIELVGAGDPLAGENGEHVGKVKALAWRGPEAMDDPLRDAAGVGWVLAEGWWPYQRPSFVTPPFAGYVSGHSTFSRAAAEVLTALTGDPYFPGGMSDIRIPANEYLVFERGPSIDMTLQWATYRDAADQCSLSRIWGGIHPPADDIPGRRIGAEIGRDAFVLATSLF